MAKILQCDEKYLYADGDEIAGSELVRIATRTTTPKTSTNPKPIRCTSYKTLVDALKELGAIERKVGTKKFVKDIISRENLTRGELVITHNPIVGGGSKTDKNIEDTEFQDPRLPYFIDIEYVEVSYALSKQWINPGVMYFIWTFIGKIGGRIDAGLPPKNPWKDYNHRPNRAGIYLGRRIANNYKDIMDFAEQLAVDECYPEADDSNALRELKDGM